MYWPFHQYPEGAVLLGGLLTGCFVVARWANRRMTWPLFVAACLWFVYAAWEWFCAAREYNIRVDLLVIPWILCVVTLVGVLALFVGPAHSAGSDSE